MSGSFTEVTSSGPHHDPSRESLPSQLSREETWLRQFYLLVQGHTICKWRATENCISFSLTVCRASSPLLLPKSLVIAPAGHGMESFPLWEHLYEPQGHSRSITMGLLAQTSALCLNKPPLGFQPLIKRGLTMKCHHMILPRASSRGS